MSLKTWLDGPQPLEPLTGEDKFYLLVARDLSQSEISAFARYVADHVAEAYRPLEDQQADLEHFGFATLRKRIHVRIPRTPSVQKGDLGEILCRVAWLEIFKLDFAVTKHHRRLSANRPYPGADVIGFQFRDSAEASDTLYVGQAKVSASKSDPGGPCRSMRKQFSEMGDSEIEDELLLALDLAGEQSPHYQRIKDMADPYTFAALDMVYGPFLVQEKNIWSKSSYRSFVGHDLPRRVSFAAVTISDLDAFVRETFELLGIDDGSGDLNG